ncbi:MAG: hypothetical protein QM647_07950 [Asticcacaulis sp.]|uniref:hypothetical protein n=1 Tax=Asticcacaulis sp. TaxID=1872648 RepID=UPI0039E65714
MSLRTRVTFSIDEANKTLIFRYIGNLTGDQLYGQIFDSLKEVESPWLYDFLVDARRLDGVILASDTEAFGHIWAELAKGRDRGRRIAVVSSDPLIRARKTLRDAIFPDRVSGVFETMEAATDWLQTPDDQPSSVTA